MTYAEIRKAFLDYMESKGHKIVPSASVIPNDPSVLFTVAGMLPWKNMFTGEEAPIAPRVANIQKCTRAGGKFNDLDDVGYDNRHFTFFEMLGNWSFFDYFKEEAIHMSWELLTKALNVDPARIVVTTHISDDEATAIWKKIAGKDAIRLDKDNWWSAGDTGACGPSTEIFYDFGEDVPGGLPGSPDEDGGRFVEIWNNVFMQFNQLADGSRLPLPKPCVDTGASLERWAAMMQSKPDCYDTDLLVALRNAASDVMGVAQTDANRHQFKILSDHIRSVGFAIADGVVPSNEGRGYVIRRILRRAMRQGQVLGYKGPLLSKMYPALVEQMGEAYPELKTESERVVATIVDEENKFTDMLENGIKLLNSTLHTPHSMLSGETAFKLYDTYGFPIDLTEQILKDRGMTVDIAGFEAALKEQKERSRADTKGTKVLWESRTDLPATDDSEKYETRDKRQETNVLAILQNNEFVNSAENGEAEVVLDKTPFYGTQGGQVGDTGELGGVMNITETNRAGNLVIHKGNLIAPIKVGDSVQPIVNMQMREQIARAHTAAHLLQAALREVMNDYVEQRGSKVAPDSVRFDFSFPRPLTDAEKKAVEDLINKWINEKIPVTTTEMSIEEAQKLGAMALFGEKYGDMVRVVQITACPPPPPSRGGDSASVSTELCGGTHVSNTGDIIKAKINSEKSIASGIRRIKMSVGSQA